MPLRTIRQQHLPDISLPGEKNPLKRGISMLDSGTYAIDLPKISWKGWCLYDDTSLIRLFSITQ